MSIKTSIVMRQGTYTWTESHYQRNTSVLTPITGGNINSSPSGAAAARLAGFRAQLLGSGASVVRVRNSDTNVPRAVQNVPFQYYAFVGPYTGAVDIDTNYAQDPNSVMLMRANSQGFQYSKNWYLSGIPDGVITTEPDGFPDTGLQFIPPFITPYQNYVGELLSSWNFRVQGGANAVSPVLQVVTSAQFPNTVGIQVSGPLAGAPAPVGGNYPPFEVVLRGFRRSNTRVPGLSGVYQVVGTIPPVAPATTYTYFLGETGNVVISNITRIGNAQVQSFQTAQYAQITPSRAGHRKRGVRTGQPLGHSRSRS